MPLLSRDNLLAINWRVVVWLQYHKPRPSRLHNLSLTKRAMLQSVLMRPHIRLRQCRHPKAHTRRLPPRRKANTPLSRIHTLLLVSNLSRLRHTDSMLTVAINLLNNKLLYPRLHEVEHRHRLFRHPLLPRT